MKKSLDANNGKAVFNIKGKDLEIDLMGVDMVTYTYLALIGLHELLVKRTDPAKSWQDIRNGKLKKEKTYKPIIKAVAEALSLSLSDAETFFNDLSPKRKIALRKDSRVRKALPNYEEEVLIDVESWVNEPVELDSEPRKAFSTIKQTFDKPKKKRKKATRKTS